MEEERKENIFQAPPDFQSRLNRQKSPNPIKKIAVIIVFIILLGAIMFGVSRMIMGDDDGFNINRENSDLESFPTSIPNQNNNETGTSTPSEAPEEINEDLERADLSIHVLNGGGVAGASRRMSDYLEGLGYNVIQIGNADNFNYEATEIQIKASKDDFLDLLKTDLEENYTVGTASANRSENETADAVVIIGAE